MRRRLLLVLTVFSLLTVAAFVVPLLEQRAAVRAQTWTLSRADDLDRFVALAARADDRGALSSGARRHAELYGEGVLVVDAQRRPVVTAGLGPDDPGVADALDAALRTESPPRPARLTPFDTEPILLWRPVGTGDRAGGVVVISADPSRAAADVGRSWVLVLAGALAAALAFVGLALALADKMQFRVAPGATQNLGTDEIVVEDNVGRLQKVQRPERQEVWIARPGADKMYRAGLCR